MPERNGQADRQQNPSPKPRIASAERRVKPLRPGARSKGHETVFASCIRLPFSLDDDGNGCFVLVKSPIKKPYGVPRVQLEIGSPENSRAAVASAYENGDLLFVQWIGEFYALAMPFAIATRTGPPRVGLIVFGRDTDSDFLAHVVERYVAIFGQSAEVTDHIYFSAQPAASAISPGEGPGRSLPHTG